MRPTRLAVLLALLLSAGVARIPRGKAQTPPGETLTFAAVADTYVESTAPRTNFNSDARLRADADPVRVAYLRFAVAGLNGRAVQKARLRLGAAGPSDNGGTTHRIADNNWNEATVTYSNRPAVNGPAIQTLGAVATGSIVEFDLTGVVTEDGVYTFAIDTASTNAVSYNSAAAASGQKPALLLTVPTSPAPAVTIVQPVDGAAFFDGDTVTLQGTARDAVDGDLSSALAWRSDLQGALGTGATLTATFAQGRHTLSAAVTDRDHFTGTAQVTVTVGPRPPANTEPLVTITAPVGGRTLTAGEPIAFAGAATDLEDGVLTSRLTWASDRDGSLGTGGSFSHVVSAGAHRITATGTDSGHATGTASVTVTVVSPETLELLPVADAYVDQASATSNFGTIPLLRVSSAGRIAYLRFIVTGAGAQQVRKAVLRLQADTNSSAWSDQGGVVQRISNTTWEETKVTFATRPALDGTLLASAGAVAVGQIVDFDVTAAVQGDGTYTFALTSPSSNSVEYRSRDSATPPHLILTLAANAPQVAIAAPPNQAVLTTGTPITFTGRASDVEDGDLSTHLAWSSSLAGALGAGASVVTSALQAGTHTITATATDADGHIGRSEITIRLRQPNTPPHIVITAPAPGTSIAAGTPVTLAATATDDFDPTVDVRWSSSLAGALGTGSRLTVNLGEGVHTLTATAVDSDGASTAATVGLTVTPTPPTVTITSPAVGATVFQGTSVPFSATARDVRGADLSAALRWTSSLDGSLGTGPSFSSASLTAGTHTITAAATSAAGLTGRAERTVVVRPPNAGPRITIQAPADGSPLLSGKPVLLAATASDAEDGDLGAAVRWTSSRDGLLGTGALRTVASLSAGTHVLTAAVIDRDGATASASVTVTVGAASLVFAPVADTYVDVANPTKRFGAVTTLQAASSPVRQAFLRFALGGTGGFAIDRAVLRLTVGAKSADGSKVGGTLASLGNTDWPEATTTFATRPAIDGPVLGTVGAVKPKKTVEFDVTAALRGDGLYSFALTSTSTDFVNYQSREATTGRPQLLVTLKQNTPPVVAITAPATGTTTRPGQAVTFVGAASDAESGNLSAQIRWSSHRDGDLGTGATLTLSSLSPGVHIITARVADPGGASAAAKVQLVINHPPAVRIAAPNDGTVLFASSLPLALAATASDVEDGDLGGRIGWTSSLDGPLGTGPALGTSALRVGTHTITAAVTDTAGTSTEALVHVRVRGPNTAPTVTIVAPAANGSTPAGTPVTLAATASDDFDENLAGHIQWTSSRDGALGTGTPLTATLTEGRHTLVATVTDSDGATGMAQVPFTVSPTPPVVAITAPPAGALLFAERPLTLGGTAIDATDGNLSASLIWTSDRDGLIGVGASLTTTHLSVGTHTVTATTTDAGGLRAQAQRVLVVRPRNTPPVVTMTAPSSGASLLGGRRLHFAATATDAEDGNLGASISWTSSRDGALGRGPALAISTLTAGEHVLTANVTDAAGEIITAAATVMVAPSTLTFPAVADTTVDASSPTTPLGTAPQLTAAGSPTKQVLLRFTVTGLEPFGIGRARLRLTTGSTAAASSNAGGMLYTITNGTWSEATTTYATRPVLDGTLVGTAGPVGRGAAADFDVTATLRGNGTYNFALVTTSSDDVVYQSREATSGGPQLIVDLRQPTDARVTISSPADGSTVPFDLPVVIQGGGTDAEDGDLGTALHWTSNLDGPLGTGPALTRWLTAGPHILTASVTDADGSPGSAAVRVQVQQRDVGVRDFKFGAGVEDGFSNEATSRPSESKLWYVDGTWWATLYDPDGGAHFIHRLDRTRNTWVNTLVTVDERPISRQDVLWDGHKLYMASRCAGTTPQNRLYRFSYVPATKRWVRDSGFPVDIPGGGTPVLTLAKDSTDRLWIAFQVTDPVTLANQVSLAHSVGSDTEWSPPIRLPVGDGTQTTVHPDDLTGIIALPGQIGVFWTNQNTKTDYFAVHGDGTADDPAAWQLEIAGQGGKFADGHINLKLASDGRLFVMAKTSYGQPGQILGGLLVRSAGGSWSRLFPISLVDFNPTRELILLDEVQRKVFAFYSLNHQAIYCKVSDMDTIAFPDGPGIPVIVNAAVTDLNNPQSTKQNVTPESGLVVIASSRIDNSYWHNDFHVDLSGLNQPVVSISSPPTGTEVPSGQATTFTASASDPHDGNLSGSIQWSSSLDGALGTGPTITRTLSTGTHTVTASVSNASGTGASATITVTVVSSTTPPSGGSSGYHLLKTIPLGSNKSWDFLTFDPATRRLFISRETHVIVLNVDSGTVVGDIPNTSGVHGIALAPDLNRGFTSNGTTGTVTIFDLTTLALIGTATAGTKPDSITYEPVSHLVFAMNGKSNNATVIDAATGRVVATIALGGKPELSVADGIGHVYVNLADKNKTLEIDARTLQVTATWSLGSCVGPTGLAIDTAHRRLFAGCDNQVMVVLNADTGAVVATLPIGAGVDGAGFDPGSGLAFSSNGDDGTLTVVRQDSPNAYSVLENVVTQSGAATMALDPTTHQVFLDTADPLVSGSFAVLVFGP